MNDDIMIPCRYCGGTKFLSLYQVLVHEHELYGMWRIGCGSCGIRTYKKTMEEALEYWNNSPSPWHPVSEKVPEGVGRVLAFSPCYEPGHTLRHRLVDLHFLKTCSDVTHWMEIPE